MGARLAPAPTGGQSTAALRYDPPMPRTTRLPDDQRESLRQKLLGQVPSWYRPWAHLAVPALFGLGIIAVAAALAREVTAGEWLTVPSALILLNAGEWSIHKYLLHHRTPPLQLLYDRHTPQHHMVFVTEDMAMRQTREWRLVLIPAWGIVGAFLVALPIPALLHLLGQSNAGLLFIATAMAYVLTYEWLHLAYHLSPASPIGRNPLIARLRRHHATHHSPELMQRWNFNVTLPLWDLVRGTIYRGEAGRGPAISSD